jgi:hypothetical protein
MINAVSIWLLCSELIYVLVVVGLRFKEALVDHQVMIALSHGEQ